MRVALFSTCVAAMLDQPVIAAARTLLTAAGCDLEPNTADTCCGQPAYNMGDPKGAQRILTPFVKRLAKDMPDAIVAPSGSCAGMLRHHMPTLFRESPLARAAREIASKTHELTVFLADTMDWNPHPATFKTRPTVALHHGCAALREMGVRTQPKMLLEARGYSVVEPSDDLEACCGFGGLFSTKFADISVAMADKKLASWDMRGPVTLAAVETGCLTHLEARARHRRLPVKAAHVATLLVAGGPV